MDAVADELIPDHDLQLQFRVAHQLPAARGGRQAAGVPAGTLGLAAARLPPAASGDGDRRRPGWRGRRLRLQREVEAGGGGVLLPQPAHGLQDATPVRGRQHPDGVQVRVPDLLAHLQVIVAVIHEGLRVLLELQRFQPLVNYVGAHGGTGTPAGKRRPSARAARAAPVLRTFNPLLQRERKNLSEVFLLKKRIGPEIESHQKPEEGEAEKRQSEFPKQPGARRHWRLGEPLRAAPRFSAAAAGA